MNRSKYSIWSTIAVAMVVGPIVLLGLMLPMRPITSLGWQLAIGFGAFGGGCLGAGAFGLQVLWSGTNASALSRLAALALALSLGGSVLLVVITYPDVILNNFAYPSK